MWGSPNDAEIPVLISRANLDRTRRRIYALFGMPRDNDRLPKLVPPGGFLMGSADLNPVYDVAPNPADWGVAAPMTLAEALSLVTQRAGGNLEYSVALQRARALLATAPAGSWHGPAFFRDTGLAATLAAQGLAAAGGGWIRLETSLAVGRWPKNPASVYLDDAWWYDTAWGRELVSFIPWFVAGQFGNEVAEYLALDNYPPEQQFVAVRTPHPYIVGMPAPLRIVPVQSAAHDNGPVANFGVYLSRTLIFGHGDRQEPRWFPEMGFWMGWTEDAEKEQWWQSTLEFVARDAAIAIVIVAVATVLTAYAGGVGGLALSGALAGFCSESVVLAIAAGAIAAAAFPDEVNRALVKIAEVTPYLDIIPIFGELADLAFTELVIQSQRTQEMRDQVRLHLAEVRQEITSQEWFRIAKVVAQAVEAIVVTIATSVTFGVAGVAWIALTALEQALFEIAKLVISAAALALRLIGAMELARAAERQLNEWVAQAESETAREIAALNAESDLMEREIAALLAAAGHGAAIAIPAQTSVQVSAPSHILSATAQGPEPWWAPLKRWVERMGRKW